MTHADPLYGPAAQQHNPDTCPTCRERQGVRAERQQNRAPRDRALKHPRRDR